MNCLPKTLLSLYLAGCTMDNFRPSFNKKPRPSIDGFIVGKKPQQPAQHTRPQNGLGAFNQYYRPKRTGSAPGAVRNIGSFEKSIDGFSSSSQSVISHNKQERKTAEFTDAFTESEHGSMRRMGGFERASRARDRDVEKKSKKSLFGRKKKAEKRHKPQSKRRRVIKRTALALGAFLVLLGAGFVVRAVLLGNNIFKGGGNSALLHSDDVDPSVLNGEGDGRINILLLGKGGVEQTDGPNLTDTIIVASIDPIANEAALLSIPRDFWVKSNGYASKINEVYANAKTSALNDFTYRERDSDEAKDAAEKAGINAIKKVVGETMGVPLHYYAMIDFAGFRKAIDTVGGIDINVTKELEVQERMWIGGRNYNLDVTAGQQHFDGFRALAFARSRKTSARGDFARADRQRAVIMGLKDKVLSTGTLANPLKINQLMSDFSGQLVTDFTVNEMLRLYDISKEISGDKVVSVGLDEYVVGDMVNGLSVQVPKAGLFNFTDIQAYVRNIMRDAFLKQEDAKVMILNGTGTTGLATKLSAELKSYGYNIISVGDAPTSTYTSTVLVDLRSGSKKYTKNYLEKRLGVTATGTLPDSSITTGEADFVIIIGAN